jgi:bacillolysin
MIMSGKLPFPGRIYANTYFRVSIAVLLCFIALALSTARFFDFAEAAATDPSPQQEPQRRVAANQVKASPRASAALQELQAATGAQIVSQVSRETGAYNFVRATADTVLSADNTSAAPEARALDFLRMHGALVGMSDTERQIVRTGAAKGVGLGSELRVAKVIKDSIGSSHVRLNQFYQGLPVFGAQLVVHMNDRGITSINGQYVPEVKVSTTPAVSAVQATATALRQQAGDAPLKVVKTELSIYRKGLLEGYRGQSVLAYNVEVTDGRATNMQVWVDAMKGTILNRIQLSHPALDRIIYTPDFNPLFAVRHEGDPLTPGATPGTTGADPINNLYVMAGHTYNLFSSGFGRDSYDGLGHTMHSVFLVNDICPNAYWNGTSTNYCPDFDADDVVSHEWGHAYTQFTHNLIYSYQSGALNESYSDIFGESADLLNGVDAEGGSNNSQPPDDGGQRWQMGEDVPTLSAQQLGILRDMWNPTNYGDPDKVSSANYACGSGDGGGVHTNSGVPNHAYAMLVDGKTFNGQTVAGIGFDRALAIYYRAMTVYQTPTTDFAQHADALEASCNDLIGQTINKVSTSSPNGVASADVINNHTCQQVAKAILAVEMRSPSPCPVSILLDPDAPPACDSGTDIFTEDWETGDDGWTRSSTGVTADWEDSTRNLRDFAVTSTIPAGGGSGSAIHSRNIPLGEPGGGTCAPGGDYSGQFTIDSPTITIPTGADDLKMRFDHWVATEAGWDGAQVEISINGGAFALVPAANYVFNPPNSTLNSVIDGNTNPNAGEPAWTGTNVGTPANQPPGSWGTTIIDLSSLADPGNTIKLRFTASQDGCNGVEGWYVDNIRIYYCAVLQAPTLSLGPDYQNPDPNGSYTLNWAPRPAGATGPDVLQESSVCGPLLSENAESGLGQWTVATGANPDEGQLVFPMWQSAPMGQKPNHSSTSFWANPVSEQETQNTFTTLTFNNPIQIPSSGITTLKFSEWYFNEDDDKGLVEVSTDNGANWTALYTNNRPMGDLPATGVSAFANEGLTPQQLDLTIYSGQTIRLRFRYALGQSNFFLFIQYGWYIDDISITNDGWVNLTNADVTSFLVSGRSNGTRCYRARTTYPGGIPSPYSNVVSAVVQLAVSPPTVSITSPADGATFTSGSDITITADASDDGAVTKVEFFEGANKLGEDTTGPTFSFSWNDVPAGNYTLSATATDNDEATATSAPVHITVSDSQVAEDIEDDDPRVSYSNGWHLVNDPDASDGHFRLNTGKDAQHGAGLAFTATGGGKITYYFAKSKKGGSAEVALLNSGGMTLEARQVNYLGSVGSARDPEFNDNVYKEEFVVPAAGDYTLALRNINGAVYIDRFKLESSSSSAQPASGPGQTSSSVNTVKLGKDLLQSITVPANVHAISVMAEATPELPIQLVLIDPSGAVLSTANNSTGFAVINKNVTQPGVYVIKVVNVSLGPVQVWTAATPLVLR